MRVTDKEVKKLVGLIILFTGIGLIAFPIKEFITASFGSSIVTQLVVGGLVLLTGAYLFDF